MLEKLGPIGGNTGGGAFDDGVFDGVKKITVGKDFHSVTYIKIEYEKGGKFETREHGTIRGELNEFEVKYPNEYITSVRGSYDYDFSYRTTLIKSLFFKTSNGRTSPIFGLTGFCGSPAGREFKLEGKNGAKLLGFYGRCGQAIDALGAYFGPTSTPTPTPTPGPASTVKLPAQGGKGGVAWDDGVCDNVRKVYVGLDDSGVTFVKFEYSKESKLLSGDGHGKKSLPGTEEFTVDPDDYLTSVKVYYDKLNSSETEIVKGLIFKTFKGNTSKQFGTTSYDTFLLEGGKIKGFHGSSSDYLHSIGAYMSPSTPMLHGKWIQVEQKSDGARCSHAIAMVGDKMYSFGGELMPNFPIDRHLYIFDFKTHAWSLAPPNGDVPTLSCLGVSMVSIGTTLYVFGGRDGQRNYNGFYSYDTLKSEWKLLTHVDKGPTPRSFFSMAADDKNVYVFGGVSATVRLNTLHGYNIHDHKWTEFPNPGETCKPRGGAGLGVVKGKIWVVYGFTGDSMDDVYCFDLVTNKWTKVETKGEKPFPRSVFAMAVLGKYIIISCGEIRMDPKAHVGPGKLTGGTFALDTESLMWEKLEDGPSPRGWCASTTGTVYGKKGLLMYGGKAPTNDRYSDILFYGVDNA